jgi:hypothetical protein
MKDFKTAWKILANNKNNTLTSHLQYAVLKAMSAKSKNKVEIVHSILTSSLTRITNHNKLTNGRVSYDCLKNDYNPLWHARKGIAIFGHPEMDFFDTEEECAKYHVLMDSISIKSLENFFWQPEEIEEESVAA